MAKATLEERINKLEHEVLILKRGKLKPKGLKVGDYFDLSGLRWRILDITEKGYHCLAEKAGDYRIFDENSNNWRESSLRKWLNDELLKKIESEIGEDNVIAFERDLISADGQTEYGICVDRVSLLTLDEYRKYRNLIPNADCWWWMLTPWSTPCNDDDTWVAVVSSSGSIDYGYCNCNCGVRPFCIFSSLILESEE